MKKLLIALMAVAFVLIAVSFAAAQVANSNGSIESFQAIIPPGTAAGTIVTPGLTATFVTSFQVPVQSNNPTASGAVTGFGAFYGNAAGGGAQAAALPIYVVTQSGGAHVTVAGGVF